MAELDQARRELEREQAEKREICHTAMDVQNRMMSTKLLLASKKKVRFLSHFPLISCLEAVPQFLIVVLVSASQKNCCFLLNLSFPRNGCSLIRFFLNTRRLIKQARSRNWKK